MAALSQCMQIKQTSTQNGKHQWLVHILFPPKHKAMITGQPRYRLQRAIVTPPVETPGLLLQM